MLAFGFEGKPVNVQTKARRKKNKNKSMLKRRKKKTFGEN